MFTNWDKVLLTKCQDVDYRKYYLSKSYPEPIGLRIRPGLDPF